MIQVDGQLEFNWLLHRKVSGPATLQYFMNKNPTAAPQVRLQSTRKTPARPPQRAALTMLQSGSDTSAEQVVNSLEETCVHNYSVLNLSCAILAKAASN